MMRHSSTFSLICALVVWSQLVSIALAQASKQANIVLLISDDDDYEHFGFMGSEIAHTPTLDKLADAGTQNNLANLAEHEERIAALRRQALTWWKGTGGGPLEVSGVKVLRKIEK